MYYETERERRYARTLIELEPSPEFLARCLRARSHIDASTSDIPRPKSDGMPSAIGGTRQSP